MKQIYFLLFSVLISFSGFSQDNSQCETNLRDAILFLKGNHYVKPDTLKAVNILKTCVKSGHSNSKVLFARILTKKKSKQKQKRGFNIIQKLAKQNNIIAMADLGILYKMGVGCEINHKKSKKWLKKAAKLGNYKAIYSLGYLHLKGAGNFNQNYKKAVKYLKKSNYPMAKYWLGYCYLFGYGVTKNIEKANELLGTNFDKSSFNSTKANSKKNNKNSNNYQEYTQTQSEDTETLFVNDEI